MTLKTIFADYQENEEEEKITKESFNFMKNFRSSKHNQNVWNFFFGNEKNQPSIQIEYFSSDLKKEDVKIFYYNNICFKSKYLKRFV